MATANCRFIRKKRKSGEKKKKDDIPILTKSPGRHMINDICDDDEEE